jgi:hypothetical protein
MKTRVLPFTLAISLLPLAGCPEATPPAPSYPPSTTLALAKSPRCAAGNSCTCRPLDSDEGQEEKGIPAGHKRFELRLPRSTSAIWVAVDGQGHYYKPPNKVLPSCFYLDLPLGEHSFTIRSEKKDPEVGLQTGLTIREYGHKEGPHWYRSFDFACGGMNKCTKKGLRAWIAFQRGLHKGVLNRCGSVKIKSVTASGTIKQKQDLEYEDLVLRFQLLIYKFEPYEDPDHPRCKRPKS